MGWLFGRFDDGRGALGLLVLRVVSGLALMQHGWPKMQKPFSWMGPDAPVPGVLQFLAAFSEFGGGLGLVVGLLTPVAAFGVACTMLVAMYMGHISKGDPWVGKGPGGGSYELAFGYFAVALGLMLTGPGRLSLDALLFGRKGAPADADAV